MFESRSQITGQQRERRLPALALSWLLLVAAALAALSCTAAGDGNATVSAATQTAPAATLAPSVTPVPPAPSPTVLAPSRGAAPTRAATATRLPSPTTSPTRPAASPEVSPTVVSPVYACPPTIVPGETPVYRYRVLATYPHDETAFTQGLVYTDGIFYEGTGLYGRSSLRRVEPETGEVLQIYRLPAQYFGEGIALHGRRILQLTWQPVAGQDTAGFVYDRDSFELLDTFFYPTEGWGLTHDGTRFIMSDGTATLHFWDLETLEEIGQVLVHDEIGPVPCLNELEYVQGQVYANVWQTDYVAVIDPATGSVTAWIDLAGLLESAGPAPSADVLNGIAHDVEGERLFVTGKLWPWLFEIELIEPSARIHLPLIGG